MGSDLRVKWDRIHSSGDWPDPARVLTDFAHLLPSRGKALEVACGLGSNALFLARRGMSVEALDLSPVAISRLRERSGGLDLAARVCDVTSWVWPREAYEVIVVSRFLDRALCPKIQSALKPGGLLYYQTFVKEKVSARGPSNPDFLLDVNELLRLFQGLIVRAFREEGGLGDVSLGWRDEACLVGQKNWRKCHE